MRFLVSNLYDFDPAADTLACARWEEVDRFILARCASSAEDARGHTTYDPTIFQAVNAFATVDLSSF